MKIALSVTSSPRNRALDILRGWAILLVLGRHLPKDAQLLSGAWGQLFRMWHRIGWSGVDLFFVLSGFLVSGLLFGEFRSSGRMDLGRFLVRRGLRIYPAFYLMMGTTLAVVWRTLRLKAALVETFFLQSYFIRDCLWLHTWTLAIEEHFYFVFGLLALLLSKSRTANPFRLLPWIWAASAFACLAERVFIPYNDPRIFTMTHVRVDALLFGVFLSYFYHFHREALAAWVRRFRWPLGLAAAGLISPVFFLDFGDEPFLTRFGLTFAYLAFGLLLLLSLFARVPAGRPSIPERAMAFVGVRSYSVYLWHLPIAYWIVRPLCLAIGGPRAIWWAVALYVPAVLAAGCASYEWVERPALAWRDRRFPARAKAMAGGEAGR